MGETEDTADQPALVCDVGRTTIRVALTDAGGRCRTDTIRSYDAATQTTISGALMAFRRDLELPSLPRRCAVAVSGVPRGDTISITNSRWFLSRNGLRAMLQHPPLILNDFAANAWALSTAEPRMIDPVNGTSIADPAHATGTFCIIGAGSGLGVAVFTRDEGGHVGVLATEAGHAGFPAAAPDIESVVQAIRARTRNATAEAMLSASGLVAFYEVLCARRNVSPRANTSQGVAHLRFAVRDAVAIEAVELFCRAVWTYVGQLVPTFGAWDGVFLSGGLLQALKPILVTDEAQRHFVVEGPYTRLLKAVPRAFVTLEYPELTGAAVALRTLNPVRGSVAGLGQPAAA